MFLYLKKIKQNVLIIQEEKNAIGIYKGRELEMCFWLIILCIGIYAKSDKTYQPKI